jgi:hypothetical protein
LVILLTLLILPACGEASTPAPSAEDYKTTIVSAFRSQRDRPSRQRSDVLLADGTVHHSDIEFVPPDRYHILSDNKTEMVILNDKVYLKNQDTWTELKIAVRDIVDLNFVNRLEESITDIKLLSEETLGGSPVQVYEYKNKTRIGEVEPIVQTRLWVGIEDGLPYKMLINGEVMSVNASTGEIQGIEAVSTIYFEYDPTIKIISPVN